MRNIIKIVSIIIRAIVLRFRNYYYKSIFEVGSNTTFLGKVNYYHPQFIKIGTNCSINEGVFFNISNRLVIGNDVTISSNVFITTASLDLSLWPNKQHYSEEVVIEDGVWIGAGAIILPGVSLKKYSVIGAGSVVTKSTEEYTVYAGNPAKKIKRLNYEY